MEEQFTRKLASILVQLVTWPKAPSSQTPCSPAGLVWAPRAGNWAPSVCQASSSQHRAPSHLRHCWEYPPVPWGHRGGRQEQSPVNTRLGLWVLVLVSFLNRVLLLG